MLRVDRYAIPLSSASVFSVYRWTDFAVHQSSVSIFYVLDTPILRFIKVMFQLSYFHIPFVDKPWVHWPLTVYFWLCSCHCRSYECVCLFLRRQYARCWRVTWLNKVYRNLQLWKCLNQAHQREPSQNYPQLKVRSSTIFFFKEYLNAPLRDYSVDYDEF